MGSDCVEEIIFNNNLYPKYGDVIENIHHHIIEMVPTDFQ